MPVVFDKNLAEHYVHCRINGVGELQQVLDYIDSLAADPDLDAPFIEIVDFSDTEELAFGYYDSQTLLQKYAALGRDKGYRGSIFVYGNDYTRGISRQFQTTAALNGVEITIATNLDEAKGVVAGLLQDAPGNGIKG